MTFWGVEIMPEQTYSQTVTDSFQITMACNAPEAKGKQTVWVTYEDKKFILCHLVAGRVDQQPLNVQFEVGSEVALRVQGGNTPIFLTGNVLISDEEMDFDEYDSDEEVPELVGGSESDEESGEESGEEAGGKAGSAESGSEEDGSEEEGSEQSGSEQSEGESGSEESGESGDDMNISGDSDEEEALAEMEMMKQLKRKAQEQGGSPKKQKVVKELEVKKPEAKKPEQKKPEAKPEQKKPEQKKTEAKPEQKTQEKGEAKIRKLPSGLIMETVVEGQGQKAKKGKKVGVRYIGKLTNGKTFDSNTKGPLFYFTLGKGEVIKGWDLGVEGMSVGSSRKLTIPPALAYGSKGAPPDIPPNSTLIFEVKLIEIK